MQNNLLELMSKLTIKTLEPRRVVVLVSLLLTLNIFHIFSSVSIINFEHAIAGCDSRVLTVAATSVL